MIKSALIRCFATCAKYFLRVRGCTPQTPHSIHSDNNVHTLYLYAQNAAFRQLNAMKRVVPKLCIQKSCAYMVYTTDAVHPRQSDLILGIARGKCSYKIRWILPQQFPLGKGSRCTSPRCIPFRF